MFWKSIGHTVQCTQRPNIVLEFISKYIWHHYYYYYYYCSVALRTVKKSPYPDYYYYYYYYCYCYCYYYY